MPTSSELAKDPSLESNPKREKRKTRRTK